jgi:PAS domain S-box-containing protein
VQGQIQDDFPGRHDAQPADLDPPPCNNDKYKCYLCIDKSVDFDKNNPQFCYKSISEENMAPDSTSSVFAQPDQNEEAPQLPLDQNRSFIKQLKLELKQMNQGYSPLISLVIAIAGIILADIIAMFVVYFFISLPYHFLVVMDAVIMTVVIIPLLYFFSLRPLLNQVEQRKLSETLLRARLQLVEFASSHPLDEVLRYALDEIESLTHSQIGFFHFFESEQSSVTLQAWSTNTGNNLCQANQAGSHYQLKDAGVWADAIRLRKPVVHNDYQRLENKKGLPEGHSMVVREIVTPIIRNNAVVAVLGLGNKPAKYTSRDLEVISTYANFSWDVVEYLNAELAIQESEEKFRTLVDWTYDWELWMNPEEKIVYISPSCERITGYTPQEFTKNPGLILEIVHPDDRQRFARHQEVIHEKVGDPITLEYRIIRRDGSARWIEHICRPLYGLDGKHLGRRVSNRDISQRKSVENQVSEQNRKEKILIESIRTLQTDIARDLHDTLGNHIGFLRMNLEYLSEAQWRDPQKLKNQLQNMSIAANEAYEMIRAMLAVLQTDNFTDPISLFNHYAEQVSDRSALLIKISSQGTSRLLSLQQIRQLFYIFREALSNAEKYSQAHQVTGEFIWGPEALKMCINDDGIGFSPEKVKSSGHYGLKFMRERAESMDGNLTISSRPGQGASIIITIPYEVAPDPQENVLEPLVKS